MYDGTQFDTPDGVILHMEKPRPWKPLRRFFKVFTKKFPARILTLARG